VLPQLTHGGTGNEEFELNILVDNGAYTMRNMGDVAMLQVCVTRLRKYFPGCVVSVVTSSPEHLEKFCPGARAIHPIGRNMWFAPKRFVGRLNRMLTASMSEMLSSVGDTIRNQNPSIHVQHLKFAYRDEPKVFAHIEAFRSAFFAADAVVAAGGGYLNDLNPDQCNYTLKMLCAAKTRKCLTGLFGQGIGPLRDPRRLSLLRRACSPPTVVALREAMSGLSVLQKQGLQASDILITGDDAIELAYDSRPKQLGTALGVSLRQIGYSGMTERHMGSLKNVLTKLSDAMSAEIVPIPISLNEWEDDWSVIKNLSIAGMQQDYDFGDSYSPQVAIELAGRCRLVITGTYHASVFSMSQGVPTICLYASEYYHNKLKGVQSQFGVGCETVNLNSPDFESQIYDIAMHLWKDGVNLREGLLTRAKEQVDKSDAAYQRLSTLV
jgi:polysaccharide pyruvyl transferase WcaK-like protein